MKKEFLLDYEAKEIAAYKQYRERVLKGSDDASFPAISQFSNAQMPLVIAETATDPEKEWNIWTQIPFAKTLVIPLERVSKENLVKMNGFEIRKEVFLCPQTDGH